MEAKILMEIIRQYKYLIKPNLTQKQIINDIFGSVRFVHNRFLDDVKAGKFMKGKAVLILEEYREEYPFLKTVDGSALMNAIFQAQDSHNRLSRYKSKRDSYASYTTGNLPRSPIKILNRDRVLIPKVGKVEMVYHRPLPKESVIRKATIMRYPDGKYYVSICVSWDLPDTSIFPDQNRIIGIDYSSTHLFVDDKGNKADMPHYYKEMQERLTKERKKMQRMVKGGKNYYKQRMKLASLYHREKNQRQDYLHKLTSQLADQYDVICMEDLDMQSISQFHSLGKRTYDNAFGIFQRMLEYKMKERGKKILYVDRYYPSSKTCHVCGYVVKDLQLSEREWECPMCHSILDRDVNAAINIKKQCLKNL